MRLDGIDLSAAAARAADDILGLLTAAAIAKALDPLDRRDFATIVARLGRELRRVAADDEAAALRAALRRLDVDWTRLSPAARDEVVRAARQALRPGEERVVPRVERVFEAHGTRIVGGTRRAVVRRFGLRIGSDLTQTDRRIATFVRESQGNFVRDEYGRRREAFSRLARDVVAAGVERGLGRDAIASELHTKLTAQGVSRSRAYWDVIAGVFANRARSFAQVSSFADAGIARYRWEAVLDPATSEACRFLHGRVFTVAGALARFAAVEKARDPARIKDLQPFVRVATDGGGRRALFYERAGRRHPVARIEESGVGRRDAVGRYAAALSEAELEEVGVSLPPIHGRCRSTVAPA